MIKYIFIDWKPLLLDAIYSFILLWYISTDVNWSTTRSSQWFVDGKPWHWIMNPNDFWKCKLLSTFPFNLPNILQFVNISSVTGRNLLFQLMIYICQNGTFQDIDALPIPPGSLQSEKWSLLYFRPDQNLHSKSQGWRWTLCPFCCSCAAVLCRL